MMMDGEKEPSHLETDATARGRDSDALQSATVTKLDAATPRATPERITQRNKSGPRPLSFVQERLWFFDQLTPGCPAYNSFRALRLTGPLDVPPFSERSMRS